MCLCKPVLSLSEPRTWVGLSPLKSRRSGKRSPSVKRCSRCCSRTAPVFSQNSSRGAARTTARILVFIIFFSPAASANRIWGCWDAGMWPRPSADTCRMLRSITASREPRQRPCPIMVAADIRLVGQLRWRKTRCMRRRAVARDCRA